jgi:regulator of protease activity HflC (stomatin/prohibitin superfamily)
MLASCSIIFALCIVTDNVTLSIDGVLYLRILDPYLASYGVEDPEFAITQLAQTTMRYTLSDTKRISFKNNSKNEWLSRLE